MLIKFLSCCKRLSTLSSRQYVAAATCSNIIILITMKKFKVTEMKNTESDRRDREGGSNSIHVAIIMKKTCN